MSHSERQPSPKVTTIDEILGQLKVRSNWLKFKPFEEDKKKYYVYGKKQAKAQLEQLLIEARKQGFKDATELAAEEQYVGCGGRNTQTQTIKNATRAIKNLDGEKGILHNIYVNWYYHAGEDWIIKKLQDRLADLNNKAKGK